MQSSDNDVPPWKKHLIARLRAGKCTSANNNGNSAILTDGCTSRTPQLSTLPSSSSSPTSNDEPAPGPPGIRNNSCCSNVAENAAAPPSSKLLKMVQEISLEYDSCESVDTMVSACFNANGDSSTTSSSSGSSEELHYGPGIVNKLKNKYLSLTLHRENYNSHQRPSILNLRKATSLENLLENNEQQQTRFHKNSTAAAATVAASNNRYYSRNTKRVISDASMKRARSVETISRVPTEPSSERRPKSCNIVPEIAAVIPTPASVKMRKPDSVVNRPKRIAPVMNEREKPPADVVKQAKMIFEKRPEQRTKPPVQTGEVAAKVANFKNIIIQAKHTKKPPIKTKPTAPPPAPPKVPRRKVPKNAKPDVSIVKHNKNALCLTPDLILTTNNQVPKNNDEIVVETENNSNEIVPLNNQQLIVTNNNERDRVSEKNLKNASKNCEVIDEKKQTNEIVEVVPKIVKKIAAPKGPRVSESNSIVFKFTDRKDVPDYVQNDKTRIAAKLERPKVGEGGIILLRDQILDQWLAEEEEEIKNCLEAPPSPCNVSFINDNILIDGKSSINYKTKKTRMRISFVESSPDIFEYPSESSFIPEEQGATTTTPSSPLISHTVPILSGSSLANYTPKSTEEFQPGVSRSVSNIPLINEINNKSLDETSGVELVEELEQPVTFSEGSNSDMLF